MTKLLRFSLVFFLSSVFLYSLLKIVSIRHEYRAAEVLYEESRAEYFHAAVIQEPEVSAQPEPEEYFPEVAADLEELAAVNPDIIGWLWLPDTAISYPLLQGKDNQEYLNTSYNRDRLSSGSIFADFRSPSGLSGDNTVVYGHNMKNGEMFGSLKEFARPEYLESHSYAYIFLPGRVLKYRMFAACKTESTGEHYALDFSESMTFSDFLAVIVSSVGAVFENPPEHEAPLLTLSTCITGSRSERFVVHGVLMAEKNT